MTTKSITLVEKKEGERLVPLVVQTASQFKSSINFVKDNKTVNVKSIMGMLNFGLIPGTTIEVRVDGEDEDQALDTIEAFLTSE